MANGEMIHLPEAERELIGTIARKLTTLTDRPVTNEHVYYACKGDRLLVDATRRIIDRGTLEKALAELSLSDKTSKELKDFLTSNGYIIASQPAEVSSTEIQETSPSGSWDPRWNSGARIAAVVVLLLLIAWVLVRFAPKPALPSSVKVENAPTTTKPATPPPQMQAAPATTTQAPVTTSTTAASAPLEGERLHVAEDNISKLQSDGKIYNDRLEGLKHDHIYPLENKVEEISVDLKKLRRRNTVRIVEPTGANLWHLRGVHH